MAGFPITLAVSESLVLPQRMELTMVIEPLELSFNPYPLAYKVTFAIVASAVSLRTIAFPLELSTNT